MGGGVFRSGSPAAGHTRGMNRQKSLPALFLFLAYGEVHDSILSGGGASRSKLSRHWLGEGGWGVEPRTLREQGGGEQGVRAPKTRSDPKWEAHREL
jgi:hypothetical protein